MLNQSLVRKCHFASGYSALQYLNDGKIWAENINGLRIKKHSKICISRESQPGWWWAGEVLLFSVLLVDRSEIDNLHKIP